jgi:uncharacterized membrane protein (DUF4010 family)
MPSVAPLLLGICIALGIGLLIGAERERRKGHGTARGAAGIRTFAVVALLGAVSLVLGGVLLLAVTVVLVGGGSLLAYQRNRNHDPGMTTEFALLLTCLLGGLAILDNALAAGLGVLLALLLAARESMHHFVRSVLSEEELKDIILFSAAALIVLPLAPNRAMGPFAAINPHVIAQLVVLVMAISAGGYVAMRWLGPRYGLPVAGFASGFVSSVATIHSMGERATQQPALMPAAAVGAVLSSVATMIQAAVVLMLMQPDMLRTLALPMACAGFVAVAYAALLFVQGLPQSHTESDAAFGRAIDLKTVAGFTSLFALVLLLSAALDAWLGRAGVLLSAAITGMADAHSTTAAAATMLNALKISEVQASHAVLVGISSNTAMKVVVAFKSGGRAYGARIVPGLLAMVMGLWIGVWW